MKPTCVIIQRFDGSYYDRLCREIFEPAIIAADYEPYRVDDDPSASIPIDEVESRIDEAAACFAELSEDNPNVWYEVGYAAAKDKALCLICSDKRRKFPFDVQHRKIIRYPSSASPSEYDKLSISIKNRLRAISPKVQLAAKQKAEEVLSTGPSTGGLKAHELLALITIFQEQFEGGIYTHQLASEMQRGGFAKVACSLALTSLSRDRLVEVRIEKDWNGEESDRLFLTKEGEDWIISNQDTLTLTSMDVSVPSRYGDTGINDDDIPF